MKLAYFSAMILFFSGNLTGVEVFSESDRLSIHKNRVYAVSSFDQMDYFSVYSDLGELVWEVPFNSKVVTWKMTDEWVYIFSRSRGGLAYYVSCIEPITGKLIWEKPIHAPTQFPENESLQNEVQSSVE